LQFAWDKFLNVEKREENLGERENFYTDRVSGLVQGMQREKDLCHREPELIAKGGKLHQKGGETGGVPLLEELYNEGDEMFF